LASSEGVFCFVLSHEIAHAVNRLESVHPAVIDWKGFRENIIGNSSTLDDFAFSLVSDDSLDSKIPVLYETERLSSLKRLFGNQINEWYTAWLDFKQTRKLKPAR
jgi:hypothetical protein